MRNLFVSKPAILVALALSLSSSVFAAPIAGSSHQRIEYGKRRLDARQDQSTDQVTVKYEPNIIETDVATIIETCEGTLVPIDGGTSFRHFKSCTYETTPLGEVPPGDDEIIDVPPEGDAPPPEDTVAPPEATATESPIDAPEGDPALVTIGITTIGAAPTDAAPTDTAPTDTAPTDTTTATDTGASSAPPPAVGVPDTVTFISGTAIAAPGTPTTTPTPTPTPEGTTILSTASDGSVSTIVQQAEQQAAEVPGRKLEVLPIGLGVFAGISVIALIVVGLVTYERTKYRKAFRQRKMAETGASMGYGGMAEIR